MDPDYGPGGRAGASTSQGQAGRKEQVLSDKHAGRIEHVLKVLKDKQV